MTATLGGIGRPLPVLDVTNVTVWDALMNRSRPGCGCRHAAHAAEPYHSEPSWGRPNVAAPAEAGWLICRAGGPAEDVRRIPGQVWETWNITAAQGKYGRGLRNLRLLPEFVGPRYLTNISVIGIPCPRQQRQTAAPEHALVLVNEPMSVAVAGSARPQTEPTPPESLFARRSSFTFARSRSIPSPSLVVPGSLPGIDLRLADPLM
jgi:hypothetical protein